MLVSGDFQQTFKNFRRPSFPTEEPLFIQQPYFPNVGITAGNLTSSFGTDSVNVPDLSSGPTLGAWNFLTYSLDKERYYDNYKPTGDLIFKNEITGLADGTVVFAPPIISRFRKVDGLYYAHRS